MDIEHILAQVDALFEQNKGEEAEKLMQDGIVLAVEEQDDNSLLQLLNEIVGYYRETSQTENVYRFAAQAVAQAERMGLQGTIPYATTLLNVANAYRACGNLQESAAYYKRVQELYDRLLPADSMLAAGLKNNISLLYQEMGEYGKARESLLEALAIVEKQDMPYELGVTYANLASTCVQLERREEAYTYAMESVRVFREHGVADSHYGAALATLGACCYHDGQYEKARAYYREAMGIVESSLGQNTSWSRLKEYVEACEKAMEQSAAGSSGEKGASEGDIRAGKREKENAAEERGEEAGVMGEKKDVRARRTACGPGLELSREYYETYGKPMLAERFAAYEGRIAVGLVGRGSDCFGFDDAASRDHDWGPDFCMWVTDDTYAEIGEALQQAYQELPDVFQGYRSAPHVNGKNRRGVMRISDFYRSLLGAAAYEEIDWRGVNDAALAAAVNGRVFRDDEGVFTAFREKLKQGYPEGIRLLKLAESMARFAQDAQYNFPRMWNRGDKFTAQMLLMDGLREAMKLSYYMENQYPPHDKWLRRGLENLKEGYGTAVALFLLEQDIARLPGTFEEVRRRVEELGESVARELYAQDVISDINPYLDAHSEELVYKASLAGKSDGELVEEIARLEFEAFDKVHNEGGRASCQNDWFTFSIMRKSQYLTWNRTMLAQYLYDFHREYLRGHNLIEEKYGRMMESTAPEQYEKIKSRFPQLTEDKKEIIEQICRVQVSWMEAFAMEYPALADNARSIHTSEDNPFNTSYETYLRGELGTYSDKMLELYGRYIVGYAKQGKNLARDIMGNSVRMYGYKDIDEAEKKTAEAW